MLIHCNHARFYRCLTPLASGGGLLVDGRSTCSQAASRDRTSIWMWRLPAETSQSHRNTSLVGVFSMRFLAPAVQLFSSHGPPAGVSVTRFMEVGHASALIRLGASSFCSTRLRRMFGHSDIATMCDTRSITSELAHLMAFSICDRRSRYFTKLHDSGKWTSKISDECSRISI